MAVELMGGADIARSVSTNRGAGRESDAREMNYPLYASALVAMLAAFYSIDAVIGNDILTAGTNVLAIAGTCFAMVYRRFGFPFAPLNAAISLIAVGLAAGVFTGWINVQQLVPYASMQGDLSLAIGLQCLSALYTFTMIDDRRVLMSSIISMAMLGLVATYDINSDLEIDFFIYMVATVFLLIHQSFQMYSPWGGRKLTEAQSRILLRAQAAYAFGAAFISLLLGTVFVIPIEAVGSHLSLASVVRSLATLGGTAATATAAQDIVNTADADASTFAIGLGPAYDQDDQTVLMHVYPQDGQEHYWRGRTYDHYTGSGWISTLGNIHMYPSVTRYQNGIYWMEFQQDPADAGISPEHRSPLVGNYVENVNFLTTTLYLPSNVNWIGVMAPVRIDTRIAGDGLVQIPNDGRNFPFIGSCRPEESSLSQLIQNPDKTYPPDIARLYIDQKGDSVQPGDAQRLLATVQGIVSVLAPSHRSEYEQADAIRRWVSHRALYSLDVSPIPDGQDAVCYFLYQSREGYCDLFASSMALLCRYAGIPARVVTGFDPGTRIGRDEFKLTEADRHAWCEVYFPGYGWEVFDPTIGTQLAPAHKTNYSLAQLYELFLYYLRLFVQEGDIFPRLLFGVIVIAVAWIVRNEITAALGRNAARNIKSSKAIMEAPLDVRAEFARSAAAERWLAAVRHGRKWGKKKNPDETATEYVRRLGMSISAAANELASADAALAYDTEEIIGAYQRIARDYTISRYGRDPDAMVMLRNEDGSADADLGAIKAASMSAPRRSRPSSDIDPPRYVYTQKVLASDPLQDPIAGLPSER